jgi:hypothetical protein
MGLNLSFLAQVQGVYTKPNAAQGVSSLLNLKAEIDFTTGSGASQADRTFVDVRTLAASASESLDLNGVLLNAFGDVINALRIKGILIMADKGNTNDVVFGGAGTDSIAGLFGSNTDTLHIQPGAFIMIATPTAGGYGVTAGTGDLLKVANGGSGTPVTYTIGLVGAAE